MTGAVVLAQGSSRWVPWEGHARRDDLVCWYALAGMAVFYTAMWPLRPLLIGSNPVLLEILTGAKESIIAAGAFAGVGSVPLVLVVAAAMLGMMKFDAIVWWAGTLWGTDLRERHLGVPRHRVRHGRGAGRPPAAPQAHRRGRRPRKIRTHPSGRSSQYVMENSLTGFEPMPSAPRKRA
jgi:hypothetical protein